MFANSYKYIQRVIIQNYLSRSFDSELSKEIFSFTFYFAFSPKICLRAKNKFHAKKKADVNQKKLSSLLFILHFLQKSACVQKVNFMLKKRLMLHANKNVKLFWQLPDATCILYDISKSFTWNFLVISRRCCKQLSVTI